MNTLKLIASSSFITVNKFIAKEVGLTEAVILGVLCSGYAYYESRGDLNGDFFPFSQNRLREETTLGETAQRNAIAHLESVGIIEQRNFGTPPQRHFRIDEDRLIQILRNQGFKSDEIKDSNPTQSSPHILRNQGFNNNNINTNTLYNNNSLESSKDDATKDMTVDEQIGLTIQAWNNNRLIKAKIDRVPFGTKRYDNMFLCIAQFGWDRFITEIRSIDTNKWFEEWQPLFDWVVNPNNFLKLMDGNYKQGKKSAGSNNEWSAEERERMEKWLNDEE